MEIKKEVHHNDLCCHTPSFKAEHHFFHWHENFEICRVENIPCSFRIDGKLYRAEVGDILVIPPHIVHQFIIEKSGTNITVLQFPIKVLLGLGKSIKPLEHYISSVDFSAEFKEKLNLLFSLMLKEKAEIYADNNLYFGSVVVALYALLQSKFSTHDSHDKKHRDEFFKMVDYINRNYKEEINLNSLAADLYISRNHASDLFKKYSGISVNDYINTLRIRAANSMIKEGSTISNAALSSGFSCIRTFNNVYKNIMGFSPSEFLNK